MPVLLGPNDCNIRSLEKYYSTDIIVREDSILADRSIPSLLDTLKRSIDICRNKGSLAIGDIETILKLQRLSESQSTAGNNSEIVLRNSTISITTRTPNQTKYLKTLQNSDIVFALGPAGTGKTFIAVAFAVHLLETGAIEKIILVKPVVEAGEKLGFLPGDIKEKVDPYFKPLYDALHYLITPEKLKKLMDQNVIEISPLAYMRGRTLNYSIVILDEAQNTTPIQMKMFLTRLGENSRAVVTGDLTQIDLEFNNRSGLVEIRKILTGINGVEFVELTSDDVVRHRLVAEIIRAYDRHENNDTA